MPALYSLQQLTEEVTGYDRLRRLERAVRMHLTERAFDPGDDFNYLHAADPATTIFAHYEIDGTTSPRLRVYDPEAGQKLTFCYDYPQFPDIATSARLERMTPEDETCVLTYQYTHAAREAGVSRPAVSKAFISCLVAPCQN